MYKSLKGSTILINDKDGEESLKIIDAAGQQIIMKNTSEEALPRRGNSVNPPETASIDIISNGNINLNGNNVNLNGNLLNNDNYVMSYRGVLPSGIGDKAYWQSQSPGIYFARDTTILEGIDSCGKPATWGLVEIIAGNFDVNVVWYEQYSGATYRLSMNNNTVLNPGKWKKYIDSENTDRRMD